MSLEISEEYVDAVEGAVGMGCGAWDMVDPKKIIAAVLQLHGQFLPRLVVDETNSEFLPEELP